MDPLTVLFVNPVLGKEKALTPPWGMLFVLAYARAKRPEHRYHFRDFNLDKPDSDRQRAILAALRPDIIGLYATTNYLNEGLKLAKMAKEAVPGCRIVLGGHHATARPGDDYPAVDCIVLGEGEEAFVELLDRRMAGDPWPRTHRAAKFLENIDFFPAWDQVDIPAYRPESGAYFKYRPQAWITASRGCPFDCTFCGSVVYRDSRPRHRRRTPAHVVDEIEFLQKTQHIHSFFFTDDEVNIHVPWLAEICDLILQRKLSIRWAAQFRANPRMLPEWLVTRMWESGCRAAGIGMESGCDDVLRQVNKQTAVADNLRAARLFKQQGIILHGCFMIGNVWPDETGKPDGESYEQIQETRRYIRRLLNQGLLTSLSVSIASPLPGSAMEKLLAENNLLFRSDYSLWDHGAIHRQTLTFHHPRLSEGQIQQTYEAIWREATFNPRLIGRRLRMIRSGADAFDFLRNGVYVLQKVLQGFGRLQHLKR